MAKPLVTDELWALIEPHLPKVVPSPLGGRPRLPDREVLRGIVFVLRTGIPWEYLPMELSCGSGMTCWRRLRDWQESGAWYVIHLVLLDELRRTDRLDLSYATIDSSSVRALAGGGETGPNPTDRGRRGSKHHVITDANGVPLAHTLTGANRHDVTQLLTLIDAVPPIAGKVGRPQNRPKQVFGDRAYDSQAHRRALRRRGITPRLAARNTSHGSGLGVFRWVAERTISWLHKFRRLRIRYERRADIHEAFLTIGCIIICVNVLSQ
jgi:transposase